MLLKLRPLSLPQKGHLSHCLTSITQDKLKTLSCWVGNALAMWSFLPSTTEKQGTTVPTVLSGGMLNQHVELHMNP